VNPDYTEMHLTNSLYLFGTLLQILSCIYVSFKLGFRNFIFNLSS